MVDVDIYPDPDGPLAHQAAEDVRSMFTARIGEQPDSHAQWNRETTQTVQRLFDRVRDELNAGRPEDAFVYMAEWVATYFGAFGLVAREMLHMAISRAYLELGHDAADNDVAVAFAREWQDWAMQTAFKGLVDDDRTIV